MKNDPFHPPLNPPPQSGEGADPGAANAAGKDGIAGSIAADERNIFSRRLAHDLRNAVAPIRNALQLLRMRGSADPDLAPITDIIERQVNEIVRMMNALGDAEVGGQGEPPSAIDGNARRTLSSKGAMRGRHVLIVDDNAAFLTTLAGVLVEAGHQVKTAADGAEALALAQDWKPDVVLLDVHMPGMSGFEVAKQLRTLFSPGTMQLVLMSGSSLDETTLRGARRAGFDHCIDKIHDFAVLEQVLRSDG